MSAQSRESAPHRSLDQPIQRTVEGEPYGDPIPWRKITAALVIDGVTYWRSRVVDGVVNYRRSER